MILSLGRSLRACLHVGGGRQIGEVTCGGPPHLSCRRDQIIMRGYMDGRVTQPKRVTLPTWGPPPPCKQALNLLRCVDRLQRSPVILGADQKDRSN